MNGNLIRAVVLERLEQLEKGYTAEHDDTHFQGDIGLAAACYATPPWMRIPIVRENHRPEQWPWSPLAWKPSPGDRKKEIVKAVALLEAEYGRIERAEKS